MVNVFD